MRNIGPSSDLPTSRSRITSCQYTQRSPLQTPSRVLLAPTLWRPLQSSRRRHVQLNNIRDAIRRQHFTTSQRYPAQPTIKRTQKEVTQLPQLAPSFAVIEAVHRGVVSIAPTTTCDVQLAPGETIGCHWRARNLNSSNVVYSALC